MSALGMRTPLRRHEMWLSIHTKNIVAAHRALDNLRLLGAKDTIDLLRKGYCVTNYTYMRIWSFSPGSHRYPRVLIPGKLRPDPETLQGRSRRDYSLK